VADHRIARELGMRVDEVRESMTHAEYLEHLAFWARQGAERDAAAASRKSGRRR
jgi:hypothetical protein